MNGVPHFLARAFLGLALLASLAVPAGAAESPIRRNRIYTNERLYLPAESAPRQVLVIHDGLSRPGSAEARALEPIIKELERKGVRVVSYSGTDEGWMVLQTDPAVRALLLNWDQNGDQDREKIASMLAALRKRDADLPVFLVSGRVTAADLPAPVMESTNDFIRLYEDTPFFIGGRIAAAAARYYENLLPPMFKALTGFSQEYEYSWHTPGHAGGNAFLKAPAGREFYNFFGEALLRSDLSISVGQLGSLLDHSGPVGESEKYLAKVFGAHRSYHVTNGSSMSNRVILGASAARGQIVLVDRNCHKSVEHAITFSGAVPVYLTPSRNQFGMIGPISPDRLTPEAIGKSIAGNGLAGRAEDKKPVHVVITNSTYDGLLYNVAVVEELLGRSVDRLHFDEAWYGYARFHPIYAGRFAMHGDPKSHDASKPTVFATQSTHKLLAALSQSSMIHVRDGRNPVEHARFNESYMMHASTSPLYPIIVSNEISAAIMDGPRGTAMLDDSIGEAVAFRQSLARLEARFAADKQWFFKCWQPEKVKLDGKETLFAEAPAEELRSRPELWTLDPAAAWHGFKDLPAGYAMLDPIKVTVTTPGLEADGRLGKTGVPAPLVTAYLNAQGIIPEKTENFSMLFLFSLGITKGKWGTLESALLSFKRDYDANTPLEKVLPNLIRANPGYASLGLRDLGEAMFKAMADLNLPRLVSDAFAQPPRTVMTPAAAYEKLVRGEVESRTLAQAADPNIGCVAATGIVPYPPGIPLFMPGESMSPEAKASAPSLDYLKGLEAFDRQFPGFSHDTHGIEAEKGEYRMMCLKS